MRTRGMTAETSAAAAPVADAQGGALPRGEEYVLKFVLVGDSNVGKSQLVLRFSKDIFVADAAQTIGMEFVTRELAYYGNARLRAQIWDTAGQERFHSLTQAYYRGAVGAMLVYDISSRTSFDNVKRWMKQVRDNAHRNIAVSLVANKSDLANERAVTTAEGLAFAEANGMDFVETSASAGENVETAFRRLIMAVARLLPEGKRRAAAAAAAAAGGSEKEGAESKHDPEQELPPVGWVKVESKLRGSGWSYENIWTGERVSARPLAPAVEYNTIAARSLTNSVDWTGVGVKDMDGPSHPVGTTCGNLGANCVIS